MGAWNFLSPIFEEMLGLRPHFAGRTATASPATGSFTLHKIEQAALVADALNQPQPSRS